MDGVDQQVDQHLLQRLPADAGPLHGAEIAHGADAAARQQVAGEQQAIVKRPAAIHRL